MSFFDAIKTCFSKYATFAGTAKRSEYWYWVLFMWIAGIILNMLDTTLFPEKVAELIFPLSSVFNVLVALPSLAVGSRRLHDVGRSGWWQLIMLTIIGIPVLLYWWACKGTEKNARFVQEA